MQTRLNLCLSSPEASQRAKMRWALLRDVVRVDWWKYSTTLTVSTDTVIHSVTVILDLMACSGCVLLKFNRKIAI